MSTSEDDAEDAAHEDPAELRRLRKERRELLQGRHAARQSAGREQLAKGRGLEGQPPPPRGRFATDPAQLAKLRAHSGPHAVVTKTGRPLRHVVPAPPCVRLGDMQQSDEPIGRVCNQAGRRQSSVGRQRAGSNFDNAPGAGAVGLDAVVAALAPAARSGVGRGPAPSAAAAVASTARMLRILAEGLRRNGDASTAPATNGRARVPSISPTRGARAAAPTPPNASDWFPSLG